MVPSLESPEVLASCTYQVIHPQTQEFRPLPTTKHQPLNRRCFPLNGTIGVFDHSEVIVPTVDGRNPFAPSGNHGKPSFVGTYRRIIRHHGFFARNRMSQASAWPGDRGPHPQRAEPGGLREHRAAGAARLRADAQLDALRPLLPAEWGRHGRPEVAIPEGPKREYSPERFPLVSSITFLATTVHHLLGNHER